MPVLIPSLPPRLLPKFHRQSDHNAVLPRITRCWTVVFLSKFAHTGDPKSMTPKPETSRLVSHLTTT
ncbi:hypothetical protein KCP71_22875 [Salmonella enterica subsp. enterica]|nr:hypothetical protein KCP71_22875 [Salmonella enterica subsp. enterica]